ncbi:hypothetical protein [Marispirochaeta aestuarii]|uniref:hypothetical protein n=1 Tax=Marispirochaeta aestuarii TaxID=1963862 RepID=UPI0029C73960|nr:hypothetical protein [Marispirochaeta aestuarii]
MNFLLETVLVGILAINFFVLGNSRIRAIIRLVAIQGLLLGILPLLTHGRLTIESIAAIVMAIGLKTVAIPVIMTRALRNAQIKREVEPLIGFLPSMILGAIGTALVLLIAGSITGSSHNAIDLVVPTSLATVITGFILLTTRHKAISQVLGYLVLENGIYVFSVLLIDAIPLVIEMGILLDLFVAVFVVSIITNHINRAFSSMDTRRLSALKD